LSEWGAGCLVSAAGWIPLRVFLPKTVLPNWMPERSASFQEALGWAAGMALLLWTFWRWLNRRGEAESPMEQV